MFVWVGLLCLLYLCFVVFMCWFLLDCFNRLFVWYLCLFGLLDDLCALICCDLDLCLFCFELGVWCDLFLCLIGFGLCLIDVGISVYLGLVVVYLFVDFGFVYNSVVSFFCLCYCVGYLLVVLLRFCCLLAYCCVDCLSLLFVLLLFIYYWFLVCCCVFAVFGLFARDLLLDFGGVIYCLLCLFILCL